MSGYETKRPGSSANVRERDHWDPRDRERERVERERNRERSSTSSLRRTDGYAPPKARKDSHDRRASVQDQDREKPRENRPNLPLAVDTTIANRPRSSSIAKDSSAATSARTMSHPPPSAGLPRDRAPSSSSGKAKNPKHQKATDMLLRAFDSMHKRFQIRTQKEEKLRAIKEREKNTGPFLDRAVEFPSVVELHKQASKRDQSELTALEDILKKEDAAYLHQIDDLASLITAANTSPGGHPDGTLATDSALKALEAKFAETQKQFSEQQSQTERELQALREDQRNSQGTATRLQFRYSGLETNVEQLKSENADIKEENAKIKWGLDHCRDKLSALNLGGEGDISEKVASISATLEEVRLELQTMSQKQIISTDQGHGPAFTAALRNIKEQLAAAFAKMDKTQTMLDDHVDEYTVIVQDLPEVIKNHRADIDRLISEIQSLRLDYSSQQDQLRQLQGGGPSSILALDAQRDIMKQVTVKLEEVMEAVNRTVQESSETLLADIEELQRRAVAPTAREGTSRAPSAAPQLVAPVSNTENETSDGQLNAATAPLLEARIKTLEEQDLPTRHEQAIAALHNQVSDLVKQSSSAYVEEARGIKETLSTLTRRLDAQQQIFTVVSDEIKNISSKAWATDMLKQLDAFTCRILPRLEVLEKRVHKAEEEMAKLVDMLSPDPNAGQKRQGSPLGPPELDPAKRQRVALNGLASSRNGSLGSPLVKP